LLDRRSDRLAPALHAELAVDPEPGGDLLVGQPPPQQLEDVELAFIRPGKPVENCFIESFNGKFRDDCLNLHWFAGLDDARRKIEEWRFDYNYYRPHSSLGGIPRAEFAAQSGLRPATPSSVLIATPTGAHEEDQPC